MSLVISSVIFWQLHCFWSQHRCLLGLLPWQVRHLQPRPGSTHKPSWSSPVSKLRSIYYFVGFLNSENVSKTVKSYKTQMVVKVSDPASPSWDPWLSASPCCRLCSPRRGSSPSLPVHDGRRRHAVPVQVPLPEELDLQVSRKRNYGQAASRVDHGWNLSQFTS